METATATATREQICRLGTSKGSWRRQQMQGAARGLQPHRCPMLLIAEAGHDASSSIEPRLGEGVASERRQGCWQGSTPSRYVMLAVPQPACS